MGHIRFEDDDEELPDAAPGPSGSGAGAPPPAEGQPALLPHVCCSLRVDDNRNSPSYVFSVDVSPGRDACAASTSDNIVKAYSLSPATLEHVVDLTGHEATICDASFTGPSSVHSCSRDGTVRGWDLRSRHQAERFAANQEICSFALLDNMLVAGGQGEVLFWDRRAPGKPVATLPDTHMEDVTQVKIHPSQHIFSASVDGLVAVHDMSRGVADEDDNFTAALNVGTSVEEIGLYGADSERLWVRTGTESLHLWEWRVAMASETEGGHGAFAEWVEARQVAAGAAAAGGGISSLFEDVFYLAGCHFDVSSGRLMLLAGNEGCVGFFPIDEAAGPSPGAPMAGAAMQPPAMALSGGHSEVVRSVRLFGSDTQAGFCVSGGEDGRLALWTLGAGLPRVELAGAKPKVSGRQQQGGAGSHRVGGAHKPPSDGGRSGARSKSSFAAGSGGPRRQHGHPGGWKHYRKQAPY